MKWGSGIILPSLLLLTSLGCEDREFENCDFGIPNTLSHGDVAELDDLDLVETPSGLRAVWSTSKGTFAAWLRKDATVVRDARWITTRCDGGIDQSPGLLACARSGNSHKDDKGAVVVFRFRKESLVWVRSVGNVGRYPKGVRISEEGRTAIAWHEGRAGEWQTWWQIGEEKSRAISTPHLAAGEPDLAWNGKEHRIVWAEFWGNIHSQVMTRSELSETKRIAETRHDFPRPRIISNDGTFVVSYDDQKYGEKRPGNRVVRLDEKGDVATDEKWLGPSTGLRGSSLSPCGDYTVALTPINWSTKEMPINVHILNSSLERAFPRQQIYAHEARFPQMDALCPNKLPLITTIIHQASRETKKPGSIQIQVLNCSSK